MTHAQFARLLPSQKKAFLDTAAERLSWPAEVVTFTTSLRSNRSYATIRLDGHHGGEFVTYLVDPTPAPHFENGRYGFSEKDEAIRNMYDRAT